MRVRWLWSATPQSSASRVFGAPDRFSAPRPTRAWEPSRSSCSSRTRVAPGPGCTGPSPTSWHHGRPSRSRFGPSRRHRRGSFATGRPSSRSCFQSSSLGGANALPIRLVQISRQARLTWIAENGSAPDRGRRAFLQSTRSRDEILKERGRSEARFPDDHVGFADSSHLARLLPSWPSSLPFLGSAKQGVRR